MAKKADKGVMAKKAGKGGGWKHAFAKAQASHGEFAKAAQEAHQAQVAFTKAVAKARKLEKRSQLDLNAANALE